MNKRRKSIAPAVMTTEAFIALGGGKIAYIKTVRSEEVSKLYPGAPDIEPGHVLWALHGADGIPLSVTDSREAAVGSAVTHELEVQPLH